MVGEFQSTNTDGGPDDMGHLPRHPSQPTGKGALPAAMDAWLFSTLSRKKLILRSRLTQVYIAPTNAL